MSVDKSCLQGIPIVWVIGGPGSGKGTQCENMHVKYGFSHLSTGDLLRFEVMSNSQRGAQIYKIMFAGDTVPHQIVDDILSETMVAKAKKGKKGFLLDGFPLDLAQADAFVADIGQPKLILYFEATNTEVLKKRLKERGNFDDSDASIQKRLDTFTSKTLPVVEKYADRVRKINVERSKEDIFADVVKIMDEL